MSEILQSDGINCWRCLVRPADLDRVTYITDLGYDRAPPTALIICQRCKGVIEFNAEEIREHKKGGLTTSTPCKFCKKTWLIDSANSKQDLSSTSAVWQEEYLLRIINSQLSKFN
jgi:hypothetical protein